jgi:hypothetical protein
VSSDNAESYVIPSGVKGLADEVLEISSTKSCTPHRAEEYNLDVYLATERRYQVRV